MVVAVGSPSGVEAATAGSRLTAEEGSLAVVSIELAAQGAELENLPTRMNQADADGSETTTDLWVQGGVIWYLRGERAKSPCGRY